MSLLSRYLGGEYEQVWHEISWKDASNPAFRDDALAVAYATMERVNEVFDIMIPRLQEIGYKLGYDWLIERGEKDGRDEHEQAEALAKMYPIRSNPLSDIGERLAAIQSQGIHLPLSIQAWYEVVGGVNFVGTPPASWNSALQSRVNGGYMHLDPLEIIEAPEIYDYEIDELHLRIWDNALILSGDDARKYHYSGGLILLDLSSRPQVDSLIHKGWLYISFIDYLRLAVSWGGFPGIARLPRRPDRDIAFITKDLPPF